MTWKENTIQSPEYQRKCAACEEIHGSESAHIACLTAHVVKYKADPIHKVRAEVGKDRDYQLRINKGRA